MKPELFAHQREGLERHGDAKAFAVFWEQGTGKTRLTLETFERQCKSGTVDALLVLAPNGVHVNWVTEEIPKHLPGVEAFCYHSSKRSTIAHRRGEALALTTVPSVVAMSYDAFITESGKAFAKKFLTKRKVMMVLDEATAVKTPGAKRTKLVISAGPYAVTRRILTGTPVTNSPFDVYAPLKFLDKDFWLKQGFGSFSAFKVYFGVFKTGLNAATKREFTYVVSYRNLDELKRMIAPISHRVTKDECLALPPKLFTKRFFDLTPKQARIYREVRDEALTLLDSGDIVTAPLAIVRLLRLHQVTSNYLPTIDGEEPFQEIDSSNPRLRCLETLLEEIPDSAIIWARFNRDIDAICEMLGDRAVRYDGAVKATERGDAVRAFQSGKAQYFVSKTSVGGKGLTLTRAKTIIYYNNDFRLENRLQSEDRAHRYGQDSPVSYVDIIAPGTVDAHIVRALRRKVDIASAITGDNLKEWI